MTIDLKSKYLGGMVGSALGDAIGELAFTYPQRDLLLSRLDQVSELRYTDDTAMAIGLSESIIKEGGINQQQLGDTFRNNFEREPWRGYASGPPTIFSMVKRFGITYTDAARRMFGGGGSLGNGAAMRIAPAGLFFHNSTGLYEEASASAEVTHAHPVGMDGAAVQAWAVANAVNLDPKEKFPLMHYMQGLVDCARTPDIREKMMLVQRLITEDVSPDVAADGIGRTVAVHESMPFAVYSFIRNFHSFEESLFCAILNGGDRDTLGAMACAISGAYLGIEAIPQSLREKLENRSDIEDLALALAEMVIF
ncbi:MAG: ADP-ribosylglycohydrolase family protein [Desulfobacteraceae bacterium]|nr:ADP-ribosylglycohydrolase family protein [Desulfobacteraceae bacterium]